ncbi:hypothetical protein CF15_05030 [Pyrodictium occultum]|uniref:Transcription regulator TrmB N-terminal domain-containing protein n=1 Tax=Pyrodictium occultum TaxID=2309 RepID=A0A0V8RVR7_PYROC|nr:winged helix-turn-helix transcriptional regulator [Pyrodictium occultum]KSW12132.1 hypothetical protein CF15_05030 [Pyrodictium occultum]
MARLGDLEERVLSYLRDHPGSGPREIADALGEPLQRVRAALQRLRDAGLAARGEEGRYYAVAPAVRGLPRRELRRPGGHFSPGDLEAVVAKLAELEERVGMLEAAVERLLRRCGARGDESSAL